MCPLLLTLPLCPGGAGYFLVSYSRILQHVPWKGVGDQNPEHLISGGTHLLPKPQLHGHVVHVTGKPPHSLSVKMQSISGPGISLGNLSLSVLIYLSHGGCRLSQLTASIGQEVETCTNPQLIRDLHRDRQTTFTPLGNVTPPIQLLHANGLWDPHYPKGTHTDTGRTC